jgi:hypothetical protein
MPQDARAGVQGPTPLDEALVGFWADLVVRCRTLKYQADWAYRDVLAALERHGAEFFRAVASHDEVNTGWRHLLAQARSALQFPESERDPSLSPRTHITRAKETP